MRARWVAVLGVVALAAACSNGSSGSSKPHTSTSGSTASTAGSGKFPAVNQAGVTPTEISVSGVASVTNPVGLLNGTAFDGVQAYFDMINSEGGVYGRKLVLASRRDDRMTNNKAEVEGALDQDNAFAILPLATIFSFTGAPLLIQNNVPTFGLGITKDWTGPPNFFGSYGALCNGSQCPSIELPYSAWKLHKNRVAVLAYSIPDSADCVDGVKASFAKYPVAQVVYTTKALSLGVTDMSADVKKMSDDHVDLVATCMDNNGSLTLAREMRQQGLNAPMYLPKAYDHEFMGNYGGFFESAIVQTPVAPLETTPQFTALRNYVKWMGKAGYRTTETSEIGWANADLFVTGLKAAGPNFTRQKVVNALNQLTDWDASGMIAPVDWTKQHTELHYPRSCAALLTVKSGKFVSDYSAPGKPFICWNGDPATVQDSKPYYRP